MAKPLRYLRFSTGHARVRIIQEASGIQAGLFHPSLCVESISNLGSLMLHCRMLLLILEPVLDATNISKKSEG